MSADKRERAVAILDDVDGDLHQFLRGAGEEPAELASAMGKLAGAVRLLLALQEPVPALHLPAQMEELRGVLTKMKYEVDDIEVGAGVAGITEAGRSIGAAGLRNTKALLARALQLCPIAHDDQQGGQPVKAQHRTLASALVSEISTVLDERLDRAILHGMEELQEGSRLQLRKDLVAKAGEILEAFGVKP